MMTKLQRKEGRLALFSTLVQTRSKKISPERRRSMRWKLPSLAAVFLALALLVCITPQHRSQATPDEPAGLTATQETQTPTPAISTPETAPTSAPTTNWALTDTAPGLTSDATLTAHEEPVTVPETTLIMDEKTNLGLDFRTNPAIDNPYVSESSGYVTQVRRTAPTARNGVTHVSDPSAISSALLLNERKARDAVITVDLREPLTYLTTRTNDSAIPPRKTEPTARAGPLTTRTNQYII